MALFIAAAFVLLVAVAISVSAAFAFSHFLFTELTPPFEILFIIAPENPDPILSCHLSRARASVKTDEFI